MAHLISLPLPAAAANQHRIAEPIEYAIVWGLGVDGLYENTWVLQRGGLYAPALREASITKVLAEIRGAPEIQSFSVYRVDHPYATAA